MSMILNFGVEDLERTAAFYREMLGFELESFVPVPGHPPVLMLRSGGAVVLFRELQALAALHPALFQNLDRHPRGVGVSLQLSVSDIEGVVRRLGRAKYHTLYEMEDDEHGFREIWMHDPDGYLVVLDQQQTI